MSDNLTLYATKPRFAALDGLRACAALGVLWIHTWTIHHNPRYIIKGIDITSLMALGGNGVDLFFVISGFCMYYFYGCNTQFAYADFGVFLKKRWRRLSPAFYVACAVHTAVNYFNDNSYPVALSVLTSLTYLNAVFPNYNPEGIFWSLTPEWHFYIIIPFLLIYQLQTGFKKTFITITLCLLVIALVSILTLKSKSDIFSYHIVFRYFQFMWGVLAGRVLLKWPHILLKYRGLIFLGYVLITYTGRVLISAPLLSLSTNYYNIIKLLGFTVMGLGFSGLLYLVVTSTKWLKLLFGNTVLSFIGKISFSFYLWHGLVHRLVAGWVISTNHVNAYSLSSTFISFTISTLILIPLATISFHLLEKNFMTSTKST
jgi:peptidoglycan/LPS O-acetylase OafA/YrhL